MNRLLSIILVFVATASFSQGRIVAKKSENGVRLKWFVEGFFMTSSVNVERSDDGGNTWTNLTPNGIYRDLTIDFPGGEEGQLLDALKEAIETNEAEMQNGIGALMIGQSISLYTEFATYAGVYFIDQTANNSSSYTYRIVNATDGNVLALSEAIIPNKLKPLGVLSNIKVDQREDVLSIGWTPNTDLEFGANIYKRSGNELWRKVNERPVFPSMSQNQKGEEEYPDYFYNDTIITIGNTYQYKVVGIDYFGEEGEESKVYEIKYVDPIPPPGVVAWTLSKIGDNRAFSNWTPVDADDLAGYRFYYRQFPDTNYTLIHEVDATAFETEFDFPGIGDYDVIITSVDESGNETSTPPKIIEFRDKIPPAVPTNVRIEPESGKMKISWNQAPTEDLLGFWVYRSLTPTIPASFNLINATATKNLYLIDNISKQAKNKFSYKVVAVDTNYNQSEMSVVASASQPDSVAPVAPLKVKAEWNTDQEETTISWSPVLENDLKGYLVFRTNKDGEQEQINITPISADNSQYQDREIFEDGKYLYQIASIDSAGNISHKTSPVEVVVKQFDLVETLTITNFKHKFRNGSDRVELEWKANSSDPKFVRGWVLYRKVNQQPLKPFTGLIQETEITDKDLLKGHTYTYQVRLYSTDGQIILSDEISITIENE